MKVTVDGIINTAREMKNNNKVLVDSHGKKRNDVKLDSVHIRNRVNSRLLVIQKELNSIQSTLTMNQIIREGVVQLKDDLAEGGKKQNRILNEIKYENKNILTDFINASGNKINKDYLDKYLEKSNLLIDDDISRLKRLQIEVENFIASDIINSQVDEVFTGIQKSLTEITLDTINKISDLKPDAVAELVG